MFSIFCKGMKEDDTDGMYCEWLFSWWGSDEIERGEWLSWWVVEWLSWWVFEWGGWGTGGIWFRWWKRVW